MISHREPGLSAADDDGVDSFRRLHDHSTSVRVWDLCSADIIAPGKSARVGRIAQSCRSAAWVILCRSVAESGDEIVLVGIASSRRPAGQAELGEDVAEVTGDGLLADAESVGDGAVGSAGGDQAEHLDLACGKGRVAPGFG